MKKESKLVSTSKGAECESEEPPVAGFFNIIVGEMDLNIDVSDKFYPDKSMLVNELFYFKNKVTSNEK